MLNVNNLLFENDIYCHPLGYFSISFFINMKK